ncbi:hypothetical protein ACNAN0_05465 [Agrilactobacillus fermenti]|uniref:hypothetical protein n=1 Tax=Agrilactobacillus fermenti TaxID=2586909 RepID=UPI003A5BD04D
MNQIDLILFLGRLYDWPNTKQPKIVYLSQLKNQSLTINLALQQHWITPMPDHPSRFQLSSIGQAMLQQHACLLTADYYGLTAFMTPSDLETRAQTASFNNTYHYLQTIINFLFEALAIHHDWSQVLRLLSIMIRISSDYAEIDDLLTALITSIFILQLLNNHKQFGKLYTQYLTKICEIRQLLDLDDTALLNKIQPAAETLTRALGHATVAFAPDKLLHKLQRFARTANSSAVSESDDSSDPMIHKAFYQRNRLFWVVLAMGILLIIFSVTTWTSARTASTYHAQVTAFKNATRPLPKAGTTNGQTEKADQQNRNLLKPGSQFTVYDFNNNPILRFKIKSAQLKINDDSTIEIPILIHNFESTQAYALNLKNFMVQTSENETLHLQAANNQPKTIEPTGTSEQILYATSDKTNISESKYVLLTFTNQHLHTNFTYLLPIETN